MLKEWSSVSFHIKSHISYQVITPTGSRLLGHTSLLMMDINPWELYSSGLLHSEQWYFLTHVSELIGPIFKGQGFLTLEDPHTTPSSFTDVCVF
jgi:hypothetical protein